MDTLVQFLPELGLLAWLMFWLLASKRMESSSTKEPNKSAARRPPKATKPSADKVADTDGA
jgi:hypothetical protein